MLRSGPSLTTQSLKSAEPMKTKLAAYAPITTSCRGRETELVVRSTSSEKWR